MLRRFAQAAAQAVRDTDTHARWGGEEILLVMPATTGEQALQTLARIRTRLAGMTM